MSTNGYHDISGYPRATSRQPSPSSFFRPNANVPREVPLHDAFQGGPTYPRTGPSHEGPHSQAPPLPGPRPLAGPWDGASVGRSAVGGFGSPLPPFGSGRPAQPANAPSPSYTFGPTHQEYPNPVIAGRSQYDGRAVVQDALDDRPAPMRWTSSQPPLSSPPSPGQFRQPQAPRRGFNGVTNENCASPPIMGLRLPSQRRGKQRALVIGINYTLHFDSDCRLMQGVEDAYAMANFLRENMGFEREDVRIMADEASPFDSPTKNNILEAMRNLVRDAQPHDSLFLYFSGHGVQIKDLNGDEPNGLDQCICAVDYDYRGDNGQLTPDTPGLIVDDVMHEIMVKGLPSKCRLTAIFDACHSGTLLDLSYLYDSNGVAKRIKLPLKSRILRFLKRTKSCRANVISLGASQDSQTSHETAQGGALRRAFTECMGAYRNIITYKELVQNLHKYMERHKHQQRPQLSSSLKIDTNNDFVI